MLFTLNHSLCVSFTCSLIFFNRVWWFFFLQLSISFPYPSTPVQPAGEEGTGEALISGCSPRAVVVATGAQIWFLHWQITSPWNTTEEASTGNLFKGNLEGTTGTRPRTGCSSYNTCGQMGLCDLFMPWEQTWPFLLSLPIKWSTTGRGFYFSST